MGGSPWEHQHSLSTGIHDKGVLVRDRVGHLLTRVEAGPRRKLFEHLLLGVRESGEISTRCGDSSL